MEQSQLSHADCLEKSWPVAYRQRKDYQSFQDCYTPIQRLVTVPKTGRPAVSKTTLVWKCSPSVFLPVSVAKSNQTIKPSPQWWWGELRWYWPKHLSKPSRLSLPKLSNPALQMQKQLKSKLKIPFPSQAWNRANHKESARSFNSKNRDKIERTNWPKRYGVP